MECIGVYEYHLRNVRNALPNIYKLFIYYIWKGPCYTAIKHDITCIYKNIVGILL